MGVDDDNPPLDDKAKRTRDLLSSFYSSDHSVVPPFSPMTPTFDSIDSHSFDHDLYMNSLTQKSNLEGLLQRHVEMAAEIKNIDTDLQMLVYENYNKFISATDTIKRMKNNIVGMEANMDQLLEKITSVQHRSDVVNTSLFEKREHIEKLHRTRTFLHKIQFIYDLPARLVKCIKSESYADAVRFYTGALPIFVAYGDSSFEDCHRESKKAVQIITKNLQEKVCSNLEPVQIRAEAASLLKQLDFPVEILEDKLLGNINCILARLQLENFSIHSDEHSKQEFSNSNSTDLHKSTIPEFVDSIHACKVIFPSSELQLREISHDLVGMRFKIIEECIKKRLNSENFLGSLKRIWTDVLLIDEALPEVSILDFILKTGQPAVKLYIDSVFSHLLLQISDVVIKARDNKDGIDTELQLALEAGKITLIEGSMDALLEFRQLLDDDLGLLVKLRDQIIYWIQVGFQNFFKILNDRFMKISGQINIGTPEEGQSEVLQVNKIPAGIVLLLAQLSLFVEGTVIPRIVEEITASFSVGGLRGYKNSMMFVPDEFSKMFRTASENFLQLYVKRKAQRISTLLRKRFSTPNWVKHKEPREVHMFVDLFLSELEGAEREVKQILPEGVRHKHRRSDSAGSSISSRSNPLRENRMTRSNTHKARNQLFETHLAKLFKQKVEIFTKIEFTQESVTTAVVKLCLKSLQEYVRMKTYNRSGFQQIQVDAQFLRTVLKDVVEEGSVVEFLLDEVVIAAAERCLDPTSLEQPILNKLVQSKLTDIGKIGFLL